MAQPEFVINMSQFQSAHWGKSVTEQLPASLLSDDDVDDVGNDQAYGGLPMAAAVKSGNIVRQLQHCYTPEDRAPSAYYRFTACSFPYAAKVAAFSGQVMPPSYCKVLPTPVFSLPSSGVETFPDASMYNLTNMVEDYMHYAQNVMVVIQVGLDFMKDADAGVRMWSERQTDISECYNSALAVAHACTAFTQAKFVMEEYGLRSKTGFVSAMRGHGVQHDVEMPVHDDVPNPLDYAAADDHYRVQETADLLEARAGILPEGSQAFSHPRVGRAVEAICDAIKTSYEKALLRAWQARDRMVHLLSIIEGPHGSVFRNMAEHSIVATLTSWMRARHAHHATLHPLDTIVVDTDLTASWKQSVEQQWRSLPELLDELAVHQPRGVGPALRMPPTQMLMRLKLAYDFEGQRMYRSLSTHADTFHQRMHLRSMQSLTPLRVFESTPTGMRLHIEKSQRLDPWRQQARFMLIPNGLFMNSAFNEDTVHLIMNALQLPTVINLLRSSRVFYMLGTKFPRFWTYLLNRFLINHNKAYPVLNGQDLWSNIHFRDKTLPRLDGAAFDANYAPFYQLTCTLSGLARAGRHFCVYCLQQTSRRSKLFRMQTICNPCYEELTITQSQLLDQAKKEATVEWYRFSDIPRTQLVHVLEFRPKPGKPYHLEMVYNKDDFTQLMMQMHNLSMGLSPQLNHDDSGRPRIATTQNGVDVRYIIGGPHGQIHEPMKVQLCYNYHRYAQRSYGVERTLLRDGHSHYAIARFLGSYAPKRTREVFDMTKDVIVARLDTTKPATIEEEDVSFPTYDVTMRHMPLEQRVFRVNKPFRVITAFDGVHGGSVPRYCQVVATHLRVGGANTATANYPLCDACMSRAYNDGMNGIMDNDDTSDSDVEIVGA